MKVKRFVNTVDFSCNVYVCSGEKGNFIIDCGYFDDEIEAYLKALPSVDFVLQTHGHFDHIMGLNDFHKIYPEVPVYIFEEEVEVAKNPEMNASALMLYQDYVPEITFKTYKEGSLHLGEYDFQFIHTPGHTKGSCMIYMKDENVLFTGDTIIESSIGRTDLPTGDEAALFRSLNKFKRKSFREDMAVYFGHGEPYTCKELLKQNSFLR